MPFFLPIQEILTEEDPRIQFFSQLKGNDPRLERAGLILVEGDQQIERLLETEIEIDTLFLESHFYERYEPLLKNRSVTHSYTASRSVMAEILGYRLHQGCMALVKRPDNVLFSELQGPIVALNRIIDPENIGSIVRNCVAFGVQSLLVDRWSADPYLRRSIRVSMGGIFAVKVARCESLFELLQSSERPVIIVDNISGAVALTEATLPDDGVYIFGSEREGVDRSLLELASRIVEIPMQRDVLSSLNVNAASAVVLAEVFRRGK